MRKDLHEKVASALATLGNAGNELIWDAYASLADDRGIDLATDDDVLEPDDVSDEEITEAADKASAALGGLGCLALLTALASDGCLEGHAIWYQITDAITDGLREEIEAAYEENIANA